MSSRYRIEPFVAALLLALVFGCAADQSDPASNLPAESAAPAVAAQAAQPPTEPEPGPANEPREEAPPQIRGLYLNASAAGSSNRLRRMLEIADETEINTFVVDVKDELGIRYQTAIPLAAELATPGEVLISDLSAMLDSLDAHGVYSIARIVVFNDPILSQARPDWSIQREDGSLWQDRSGNSWVSPWDERVWDYNLAIAEEVARAGFDEIQFDYVRFPEQFQSLPPQVHPRASGTRTDAIAAFLREARSRLHPLGVAIAADVFGLSPNTYEDVGIGQQWETLSAIADHILPMMYPSHYLPTHLPNVPRPNAMPYETVFKSAGMARLRTDRMQEAGLRPARVIVWLQAFQAPWLGDGIEYGAEDVELQKEAVYDAGFEDWILWHPGSRFDPFLPALESTTVSRATGSYEPPEDVLSIVNRFEELGIAEARERAVEQAEAGR